ncbi:M1 family metallopeptidase [Nocardioides aquiterrae]|uniref:Aminopeptidase N n=1 Tax=Nocardioides aquiterrae TaxID=203799 RepID=A0ABP4FAL8_9ACTN
MTTLRHAAAALATAGLIAGLVTGCTTEADRPDGSPAPAPEASPAGAVVDGYSTPVEDRVYPEVGDPGVDTLHYALDLTWDPVARTLDAVEELRFRATTDAEDVRLDLAPPLRPSAVTVDGEDTTYDHEGKDLVVHEPVTANDEHTLVIRYSGSPEPVPAPVQRSDFSSTGWTVTDDGGVWTMQEPYGAYSWYAVNDQPSDKALYDVTITVPAPMVGVSNGTLVSRRDSGRRTTTHWRLDEPASSYLVTVAIGDFTMTRDRSSSGVPITYWTPTGRPGIVQRLRRAPAALDWLEDRLGPYPFDTLGFLVVDSKSGMETQTMITLGDTPYATSPEVLVHEMAHHWYGDEVTPVDWRDVWMSEGMATYLQGVWQSEDEGRPLEERMDLWATFDTQLRGDAGPPGFFHEDSFGAGNVYYIPAVMWDELRKKLGDDLFWKLVRAWPASQEDGNANYQEITTWWSERSGQDLSGFFSAWLLSPETPQRG